MSEMVEMFRKFRNKKVSRNEGNDERSEMDESIIIAEMRNRIGLID